MYNAAKFPGASMMWKATRASTTRMTWSTAKGFQEPLDGAPRHPGTALHASL